LEPISHFLRLSALSPYLSFDYNFHSLFAETISFSPLKKQMAVFLQPAKTFKEWAPMVFVAAAMIKKCLRKILIYLD
jgi:hypothetical protein